MVEPIRVAVVRGESILERGVYEALSRIEDIEVEVLPADAADLLGALQTFRPHAVIADEMDREFVNYILARSPGTVVLTLSLLNSRIGVYHSRQVDVASIDDLLAHVRAEIERAPQGLTKPC